MTDVPNDLQMVNVLSNVGGFAVLALAFLLSLRAVPKLMDKLLTQYARTLDTFAEEGKAERESCERRFNAVLDEIREGRDAQNQLMRDLAQRNFDELRKSS